MNFQYAWVGWGSACPVPPGSQQVPTGHSCGGSAGDTGKGCWGRGVGAVSLDCQIGHFCNYASCLIYTEIH